MEAEEAKSGDLSAVGKREIAAYTLSICRPWVMGSGKISACLKRGAFALFGFALFSL